MAGWQEIEVAGKSADVLESDGPPRHVAVFLHSSGRETLADPQLLPFAILLRSHQFACVCPHGGNSWWTDRIDSEYDPSITAERYLLNQLLPWMQNRWPTQRQFGIFGISMGGQGALRLAFKYPAIFPVVAAISPAIEYHQFFGHGWPIDAMYTSKEQCRQDTVPMHLHPSHQPPHVYFACDPDDVDWHRGCDRLHEKMAALGAVHQSDLQTRAGGHSMEYFNSQAEHVIGFMADGLTVESRRLL